jgi:hypothetical protein
MNARTLGAVAVILAILVPQPSHAAGDEDPAALVLRGVDRYRHEDYEGARALFARAYELAPSPRTLFNLALAELQSAHAVESVRHMRAYLAGLDVEADQAEAIKTKWLPRAEAQTSRIQVDAPAGAEIEIDGQLEGRAPLQAIDLHVGDHQVIAHDGSWSHWQHVVTRAGELVLIHFEQPASARAQIAGPANPPLQMPTAPTGPPTAKLLTVVALASGAVVATGLGIAFAVASRNEANSAKDLLSQVPLDPDHPEDPNSRCLQSPLPPPCPRLQADNRAAHDAYLLSNGLYGGAAVLAGAAALTWFIWPARASGHTTSTPAAIIPTAGPDRVGFMVRGAW